MKNKESSSRIKEIFGIIVKSAIVVGLIGVLAKLADVSKIEKLLKIKSLKK